MWVKGEIFRNLAEAQASAQGELDRNAQPSLFDRFDWFARTQAHCPPAGRPVIARARVDGSSAWLFLTGNGRGHGEPLSTWYTLAFRPIFTGDPSDKVRSALLTAIARRLRRRLTSLRLTPMPEADCALMAASFRRAHWRPVAREASVNWTIDVTGKSFADYWAERPGELRSTVKRKGAKADMAITIYDHFDPAAWEDYESVYANSWKPEEGSRAFLRDMAETEGAAGTLRLGIGRIGGEAIAAQLWTVENGVAIIHKLAHRDDAGEFSPGSLLSAAMFEHAIDVDRVTLIDFGTGDDPYKRDWMDSCAPLYTLELFNAYRPQGLAKAARAHAAALVARLRSR